MPLTTRTVARRCTVVLEIDPAVETTASAAAAAAAVAAAATASARGPVLATATEGVRGPAPKTATAAGATATVTAHVTATAATTGGGIATTTAVAIGPGRETEGTGAAEAGQPTTFEEGLGSVSHVKVEDQTPRKGLPSSLFSRGRWEALLSQFIVATSATQIRCQVNNSPPKRQAVMAGPRRRAWSWLIDSPQRLLHDRSPLAPGS